MIMTQPPTFVKDRFSLDGEVLLAGWHDPTLRWNGFACPYFPIESVREIKVLMDKLAKQYPDDIETIEIDDDGKVFMVNEYDGRVEEKPVNDRHRLRDDPSFPDVPVYSIGAFAWVWLEHNDKETS